jgi:hypothetical protein
MLPSEYEIYLDYVNNFLTVAVFAEYYGMSIRAAHSFIDRGRAFDRGTV